MLPRERTMILFSWLAESPAARALSCSGSGALRAACELKIIVMNYEFCVIMSCVCVYKRSY